MLVRLTESNLVLARKLRKCELRINVEDLEALKELFDKLEGSHMETEKQLNEDPAAKEAEVREHLLKVESPEKTCVDYEGTTQQLVLQFQTKLDQLCTETQTANPNRLLQLLKQRMSCPST